MPGALDERLADADDERADHGAGDRADAAEHRRHERLQTRHGAGGRDDGRVIREVQQRADSGKERADDKRHGDDLIDLDAHELAGLKILCDRAHGHADLGVVDEPLQQQHEHEHEARA